ncbi:MAG: QueT transporter family protein [Lachnospiraceae bacterium]|nr:QueT transporter family protein [Lachnospiraceae bacterium]
MLNNKKTLFIVEAAMIAAIYTVLTIFIAAFDLASGAIQVRVSEALTILPAFTPAAVPGLFIGCLLSNTLTGAALLDIVFGSIATLIGAIGSYSLRNTNRFLVSVPPIVSNMLIVPFILSKVYQIPGSIHFFMLTVGVGEIISCLILGQMLYSALLPVRHFLRFPAE